MHTHTHTHNACMQDLWVCGCGAERGFSSVLDHVWLLSQWQRCVCTCVYVIIYLCICGVVLHSLTRYAAQFLEIPGSLKDSSLCVWPTRSPPRSLAWLTGAGVYYVTLSLGRQQAGESVFVEKSLIPYWSDSETSTPVGMALTEFHCLLLYRDRWVWDGCGTLYILYSIKILSVKRFIIARFWAGK